MPQVETSNRQNITSAASKRLLSVYVGVSLDLGRFASNFNFFRLAFHDGFNRCLQASVTKKIWVSKPQPVCSVRFLSLF